MTALADLIVGAKFRADLTNSDRVSDAEWGALANEAIQYAWSVATVARPDFQVASQDFTISSGVSASFTVPTTLYGLIDVVANPDTTNEFSLGPYAWSNRRAPGSWAPPIFQTTGAQKARLMGSTIYLEPAASAGATYRCWFCPKPTKLTQADFTVRVATLADLPSYTAGGGPGTGRTLTSTTPGTMIVADGVAIGNGDRILCKNLSSSSNNGIYSVINDGANGAAWVLTRATDFDSNAEIKLGQTVFVTEGSALAQSFWSVSTFAGVDLGAMVFVVTIPAPNVTLDAILDPFVELLKVRMAIPAVIRDERSANDLKVDLARLESDMSVYFKNVKVTNGPQKMVDSDARGPMFWMSW